VGTVLAQSYLIGNPHDRQENVDLFIRPISIPVDWRLSIVNTKEPDVQGEQVSNANPPKYPVREVEAGKHYFVRLPAKAQVKIAAVVIPVGQTGARTTARWAVEGMIGDELIGGMVHEIKVPYIIAGLQLPAVGSKEVEEEGEELPAPPKPWLRILIVSAAGVVLICILAYFIFWRRRRHIGAVQGS
jgi:hypothetical protein